VTFTASTYLNFVAATGAPEERLFLRYIGPQDDFDIVVVGSGIGGGLLADAGSPTTPPPMRSRHS
jgi:hypothetical protein